MRALVTGASGFIGSTLIEELNTLGFEVRALMRRTSSSSNLEGLKFERAEGDLTDAASLRDAVREVNYVFHLAGAVTARNRAEFDRLNAIGTKNLAEAVAEVRPGLSRFVYVSSLAAGGPSGSLKPRDEEEPDHPVSAYGESKLAGERYLMKYRHVYPVSIVRPPMVYGPKDKATFVFIKSVSRNLVPMLPGSPLDGGHKYYSSIHSKDLCRGIVQAGVASLDKVPSGEIFYLADDQVATYEDLMTVISEKLNRNPLRVRLPKLAIRAAAYGLSGLTRLTGHTFPLNVDKLNEILPDYWICSNAKAKKLLGFAPEYDFRSGWANAIEWYQRQRWI